MIEIFKTNVPNPRQANLVLLSLKRKLPGARINFDLDDCDKILRIDGINQGSFQMIVDTISKAGYQCEVLD